MLRKILQLATLVAALVSFAPRSADAATLTVCASGCTYTDLQLAIDAAVSGDVITLKAGETFSGAFRLKNKGPLANYITIRSDSADGNFPAAGVRIDPSYSAFMPKLQGVSGGAPTIKADAGADHYKLMFLEFIGNPAGFSSMIQFGTNNCDVSFCQEFESQEPTNLIVDRVYLHADPIFGQKRGIDLAGKNITIINSYIAEIAGLGQDAVGIGGANGHGPVDIENNRIESTTENILFGGDDPNIETILTVKASPAATTSSATVDVSVGKQGATHTMAELAIGQRLAVLVKGGTDREFTYLRSKSGSGSSSIAITFDPIADVPDSPGDIRGGVVLNGLTVRRNYFTKPLKWLNPITDASTTLNTSQPKSVSATASTASGSLAAGTYFYTVVAVNHGGYNNNDIFSNKSTEVSATLSATGKVTISWSPVTTGTITHYRVFGRAVSGAPSQYWEVAFGTNTYVDTGTAGTTATLPKASYWQLKNLFEIKAAQNAQVDSNILEYQWAGSDAGPAFWIKSVNQVGGCEFCESRDIVIEKNLIRHVNGFLTVSGSEFSGGNQNRVAPMTNLTVRNNLVYDSGSQWALSKGGTVTGAYPSTCPTGASTTPTRTTPSSTRRAARSPQQASRKMDLTFTNNMVRRESNGVLMSGAGTEGTNSLNGMANTYTFLGNAIAGASSSIYPAGNFFPTVANWEAEFVNYSVTGADNANGAADFHLRSDSTYHNGGTDGKDVGADIDAINTATNGVLTGGAATSNPPSITTTTFASGTVGTAYTQTVSTSGGTAPLVFSVSAGTLPAGLSLNTSTGVVSGTPTAAGSSTFTILVTDNVALTASQAYTVVINAALVPVSIVTGATLPSGIISAPYTTTLVAQDGRLPYTWTLTSGTLPTGLVLDGATGIIAGTPTTVGSSTFTIQVQGLLGTSASRAFTLAINDESMPAGRPYRWNLLEANSFRRRTAPTSTDKVVLGDLWVDTSLTPPQLKMATAIAGSITWSQVFAQSDTHGLLSTTHTDTQSDAPQAGDLIIGGNGSPILWQRLQIGSAGTVLSSDGTTVNWATPTVTLPDPLIVPNQLTSPIVGIGNYASYTPASPGCSASNLGRIFYDSADNLFKACQGPAATPAALVGGGSGSKMMVVTIHTPTSAYTLWGSTLPASGANAELMTSTRHRTQVDLTGFTQARVVVKVGTVANTGATLRAEYSTDGGTTWNPLDGSAGPAAAFDTGGPNASSWVNLASGAKADVQLRILGVGGNSTATPSVGLLTIQFK
jgi:hypothetical protein